MRARSSRALAFLLAGALAGAGAHAQTAAGTVKRVAGHPTLLSASGSRAAQVGGPVFAGDRVVTGQDGAVGITLADGTLLSVGPRAAVAVQQFEFDAATRRGSLLLEVAGGAMRMVSGLIARTDPAAVAIRTPTSVIGVRGTDMVVDVGNAHQ